MSDNKFYNIIAKSKVLRHVIAILIFFGISGFYTNAYFANIEQSSTDECITQSNSLWDNASMSGCPTVSHRNITESNLFAGIVDFVQNGQSSIAIFCIMLASLIGIYILLNTLKISPASAIIGSISFGIFTYGIAELQAGEFAEMIAIGMVPYIISGIVLIFSNRKAIGSSILLIASALQIATCHYQIVYYTLFIALAYIIYAFISNKTEKKEKFAGLAITIVALGIALFTNSETMFQEYEYQKYSEKNVPNYDISQPYFDDGGETLSLLLSDIKGGKSNIRLASKSETYNLLYPLFGEKNAQKIADKSPMYFGKKFFSNGSSYIGALTIFLALFGCICSRNKNKWWTIAIVAISIILSCGNIEYFITKDIPLFYNFSTYSNILIIAALGITILASLGTEELINDTESKPARRRISLYISAGIPAIILLIFVAFPGIAGYSSNDTQNMAEVEVAEKLASYMPQGIEYAEATAEFKTDYVNAIRSDRLSSIRRNAAKSLIFIILGAIIVSVAIRKKVNGKIIVATIAILATADLTLANISIRETATDENESALSGIAKSEIQADHAKFRVANIGYDLIQNDKTTCLSYNSLGGNGYCLKRYSTFCDSILNKELALTRYSILSWAQRDGMTQDEIQEVFASKYKSPILDMLNVKYIILSERAKPLTNTHASGNVWLADSIRWADSEMLEIALLQHVDTRYTAIVNEKYKSEFADVEFAMDSSDYINLTFAEGDTLKYTSSCKGNRMAVFSEIFYPKGWKAYIDGQKTSFFRCNYILRGMIVPSGNHEIEFRYEPKSAEIGRIVSTSCNATLLAIIAVMCVLGIIKRTRQTHTTE